MGSLYRSEEMRLCQIILEKDAAFSCVAEIGKESCVQFKDLNEGVSSFQRLFVGDVRRFDEMERKLRFLEKVIRKDEIPIIESTFAEEIDIISHHEIVQLEQTLADLECDVIQMDECSFQLKKNYLELKEWKAVLEKAEQFFQDGMDYTALKNINEARFQFCADGERMGYVVGVILREKINAFERVLWRASRHTVFLRYSKIHERLENTDTGEKMEECVFIVFFHGDSLRKIIDKVSEGFKAKQYNNCPISSPERRAALEHARVDIADMSNVIGRTEEHRLKVLNATAINLRAWFDQVRLYKFIYHTLNYFTLDGIGKFFVAECWIPLRDVNNVRRALEAGAGKNGGNIQPMFNILHTDETPPTYNRTNKFTKVFQDIVDAYGVASYLEVNPAPFIIITFPFIFACMFGDFGHGALIFLVALYLVLREKSLEAKQIQDEFFTLLFGGRYIVLLMGIFSIYAGVLYNDAFGKSFNIFGSSWRNPYNIIQLEEFEHVKNFTGKKIHLELNPQSAYIHDKGPYAYGLDPIWSLGENKLKFLNSMKMKLSVIVGVAQMTFGLCLSLQNYRFFKSSIDIYVVFIPQLIFMTCIFIYLCVQIILKWIFFSVQPDNILGKFYPGSHCAPSLLIGLIKMLMLKERVSLSINKTKPPIGKLDDGTSQYPEMKACYLTEWYSGQSVVETALVLTAIACILVMLMGKPIYIFMKRRMIQRALSLSIFKPVVHDNNQADDSEEELVDILVHHAIHIIEYVLGCVSHTASYLRLWALSLAHAQLSETLWKLLSYKGLKNSNFFALYYFSFIFGSITFTLFVPMEGLSAFLHALRLHWVEFQSKFYLGLGHSFVAFSFKDMLRKAHETDS